MSQLGASLAQYLELSGKTPDMRLSALGIRSPEDVADLTMEVNAQLGASALMTNRAVWNILTAGESKDPSFQEAMQSLTEALEERKRVHGADIS